MTLQGVARRGWVLVPVFALALSGCTVAGSITGSSSSSTSLDSADGVTIDSDVFAYDEENDLANETFVVTGAPDPSAVVTALTKAASRFMMVDEKGTEYPDQAGVDGALMTGLYTPNYVSDPQTTPDGIELYVDCKGAIEEPMAKTFRKILREELTSAGVRAHVKVAKP